MKKKAIEKMSKILSIGPILYFFILSLFTFFLVEILNDNIWFFEVKTLRITFMLLNVFGYSIIYIFIYSVTDSVKIASISGLAIFNIIGMINYFVCLFRGVAFKFPDIFSVNTAVNVIAMYDFKISIVHVKWLIVLIATILFIKLYLKNMRGKIKKNNIKMRALCAFVYLMIILGLVKYDYSNIGMNSFDGWNLGGYLLYFLDSISAYNVQEPNNYTNDKYENISDINEKEFVEKKQFPNIIVIMNESFCDVERLVDIDTNKEIMPFFQEFVKADNIIEGNVYVSVYAGNTANTEMEFLTASSMGFWGKDNVCYTMGYKQNLDIIPKWMNEIGYETYAIHPARGENYARKNIYEKMQFEQKLFIDEFLQRDIKVIQYPDANYFLKNIINDSEDYQVLKEIIEKKEDPVFIFNTTIQNHGGYKWRNISNIEILNNIPDSEICTEINEYLSVINQSDVALKDFISEISMWDEDTIVLFFGDHQPNITRTLCETLSCGTESKDFYTVPFFIWANYDIETRHDVRTSVNYLQNMLLEASGIGLLNDYQQYISQVEKEYPILNPIYSEDKEGRPVDFGKLMEESSLVQEYYKQSYKLIYDSGK